MMRSSILRTVWCIAALGCAALVFCPSGRGQGGPDRRITAIEIRNNKAMSKETILSKIKSKVGEIFSQEVLSEDLKRLYATDYFTDVSIEDEEDAQGVKVIITVAEKPVIESIEFEGNKAIGAKKLLSSIKSKAGEVLNYSLLAQDVSSIKGLYEKKGYNLVEVKHWMDISEETNRAKVCMLIDEKIRVKISRIDIVGNKSITTRALRKLLMTKPAWLFNRGVFEEEVFGEDLEKVKIFYRSAGFLDVVVTPALKYSEDGMLLVITITIEEGKKYLVGEIVIKGSLAFPEKEIRDTMKLKTGGVFSDRGLREDVMSVERFYFHHGYVSSQIDYERNLNPAMGNIDISYTIDSRNVVFVRKIDIQGNVKTKDIVIRRELRIYPGEKFDGEKIRHSKERLYNLGFFEDVSFENKPTDTPDKQDLIVDVKESKTGEFSFGAGYSSIDEFIGFAEVRQRNFDLLGFPHFMGAGQDLAIKVELGTVRSDYLLSWTEPWIFGFPYSLGFDLYQTTHSKRRGYIYEEVRQGGDVRLGKDFTDYLHGDIVYRLESVDISDVSSEASQDLKDEEGTNLISSVLFDLTLDTRDNRYNPTRGYVVTGDVQPVGGILGGDKDFIVITGSAKYYQSVMNWLVIEFKGRAGVSNSYGKTKEVPVYERFYAGGANTIRGYEERRVSPRDPGSNEPIGGEAFMVGNVEGVFPIYENIIKGAVFFDVGNVWRRIEDFGNGNFRSGTGVGLRIKTPIGPVKLDYGFPLSDNYGEERKGQFYFSISHGF